MHAIARCSRACEAHLIRHAEASPLAVGVLRRRPRCSARGGGAGDGARQHPADKAKASQSHHKRGTRCSKVRPARGLHGSNVRHPATSHKAQSKAASASAHNARSPDARERHQGGTSSRAVCTSDTGRKGASSVRRMTHIDRDKRPSFLQRVVLTRKMQLSGVTHNVAAAAQHALSSGGKLQRCG